MPKTVVNKSPPNRKQVKTKLSNSKSEDSKSKRRKRFKVVPKKDNSSKMAKKVISNIKHTKGNLSSNWQAFKEAGLYQPTENKKKPKSLSKSPSFRKVKRDNDSKVIAVDSIQPQQSKTVDFPTEEIFEDSYITDLVTKDDKDKKTLTRCIAMDCEMVGVDDGKESVLARVSLVNQHGYCVYDKFVKPKESVTDYRTHVSGVRPADLKKGEVFEVVQKEVADILKGRVLVGHALRNDMKVLHLHHPPKMVRDTARFKPFREKTNARNPALKKLATEILGVKIQSGEHNSIEDAKAAMQLYNLYQKEWEDHRLKKKLLRKKNAHAAAVADATTRNHQKNKSRNPKKTMKTSMWDEYAAC